MIRKISVLILLSIVLSACSFDLPKSQAQIEPEDTATSPAPTATQPAEATDEVAASTATATPAAALAAATQTPTAVETTTPEAQPTENAVLGPDSFPPGINPLTGLPVADPQNLLVPPALVSITNFPAGARPQAGLSFSPFVFEIYIGEGMTRYLAMFYGDFPEIPADQADPTQVGAVTDNAMVGPIRSGRLPYESLRKLFNGFLVMASGASSVVSNLSEYANVYGSDADNVNSALIDVTRLEEIARANQQRLGDLSLTGLAFSPAPPLGGLPGWRIWLKYAYLNQINWYYDEPSGAYLRYQDHADGETFELMTDRLNDEALTYENVVILFAPHEVVSPTVIDINLLYMKKMPALLFRDGRMYEIFWTTISEEYEVETGKMRPLRFVDANGEPFPLKPGQTWVEVVQLGTPYEEVPDSDVLYDLANKTEPGSGVWAVRWFPPKGAQ